MLSHRRVIAEPDQYFETAAGQTVTWMDNPPITLWQHLGLLARQTARPAFTGPPPNGVYHCDGCQCVEIRVSPADAETHAHHCRRISGAASLKTEGKTA